MKKILYIHGLSSSGASSTAQNLRRFLSDYEVLSPDLPVDPYEAYDMLVALCEKEQPAIIIGTSMGGMFAQQVRGYRKILVNPSFHVSERMRKMMGTNEFLNPRSNGDTHYEITPRLCDAYSQFEEQQFAGVSDYDKKNTYALFGKNDTLVNGFDEYKRYYKNARMFKGGHRQNSEDIRTVVVPLVRQIMLKEELAASPLFNLSLSSKELFHSNFLYWIALRYPGLFIEICRSIGCKAYWAEDRWTVKREHRNFDLCIEDSCGRVVFVLENKVKSIPVKSQLDDYYAKSGPECRDLVLLSLATAFPDMEEIKDKWHICNYKDLCEAIQCNKNRFVSEPYESALIDDYCSFIKNMHELSATWQVEDSSRFLLPESDKELYDELRIGDVQDKIWYSQLIANLNTCLSAAGNVRVAGGWNIGRIKSDGVCLSEIYTNWGFTHGQGLLEAKVRINNDYVLLIQLQGNRYCHGIEWIKEEEYSCERFWELTESEELIRKLSFFQFGEERVAIFPDICEKNREPIPTRKRNDEFRIFNKYGNRFLYQTKKIKSDVTVHDVLTAVKEEVIRIIGAAMIDVKVNKS